MFKFEIVKLLELDSIECDQIKAFLHLFETG